MSAMTSADAEKKIIAALKKAGIEQTRIKSDETHVEVVGLGVEAIHVSVPLEGLTEEKLKAAIEEALKAVPKPEATPADPNAPTPAPAEDDDDDDDPATPAAKGSYKPIGRK